MKNSATTALWERACVGCLSTALYIFPAAAAGFRSAINIGGKVSYKERAPRENKGCVLGKRDQFVVVRLSDRMLLASESLARSRIVNNQ
jgi:hypothetical protein